MTLLQKIISSQNLENAFNILCSQSVVEYLEYLYGVAKKYQIL